MKHATFPKSGRRSVIALLAILAPFSLATAGELNLSAIGNHFQEPTAGATTPTVDMSRYEKLNLSAIGDTAWVAKRGAEGPRRSDAADQAALQEKAQWEAANRDLQARLGSVGGNGTN